MSSTFIISSSGFAACLVLLFYFIAKYRRAGGEESPAGGLYITEDIAAGAAHAAQDAVKIFGKNPSPAAKEIADIKEKLRDLHYRLEEIKLLEEKRNAAAAAAVARVEQRVTTFENEYVNKLQPTLYSLISELENIQNKAK
ncbi:MAG: hypothetical protein LBL61_03240 [Elusimicrobiota bacterium]|jgi:hypothetical protein|nr:hypothetical protein [Elusimicrobiota bacterium]